MGLQSILDVCPDEPLPDFMTLNEDGLWCDFCGELQQAACHIDADYIPPSECRECGAPDPEEMAEYFT